MEQSCGFGKMINSATSPPLVPVALGGASWTGASGTRPNTVPVCSLVEILRLGVALDRC